MARLYSLTDRREDLKRQQKVDDLLENFRLPGDQVRGGRRFILSEASATKLRFEDLLIR